MPQQEWDPEAELEQRLAMASQAENTGEDMNGTDYVLLFLVTGVLPLLMMVGGWFL